MTTYFVDGVLELVCFLIMSKGNIVSNIFLFWTAGESMPADEAAQHDTYVEFKAMIFVSTMHDAVNLTMCISGVSLTKCINSVVALFQHQCRRGFLL